MNKNINLNFLNEFNANMPHILETYQYEQSRSIDEKDLTLTIFKLVDRLAHTEQVDFNHAFLGICTLLQTGAYLKSVTNRKVKIADKEFTKRSLLFVMDQTQCKYTLRIVARFIRDQIADISYNYRISGHLYARFKIENATLIASNSDEENRTLASYCTDFQIDNPNTPEQVRQYLANREIARSKKKN